MVSYASDLGDFLKACKELLPENDVVIENIGRTLGFQIKFESEEIKDRQKDTKRDRSEKKKSKSDKIAGSQPESHKDTVPSRLEILPSDASDGYKSNWDLEFDPIPNQAKNETQKLFTPLYPEYQTRNIVFHTCSSYVDEGKPIIEDLVSYIAGGKPIIDIKRTKIKTLRRGLDILVDVGTTLEPFYKDQNDLLFRIEKIFSPDLVNIFWFEGCPLFGVYDENGDEYEYKPSLNGNPILILTDFGIPGSFTITRKASHNDWIDFFSSVKKYGNPIISYVPYPPDRWPLFPRHDINIYPWGDGNIRKVEEIFQPYQGDIPQIKYLYKRNPSAFDLGVFLSVASILEPEVIRMARKLLIPGSSAAIEGDLWNSPIMESRNPSSVVINPKIKRHLQEILTENKYNLSRAAEVLSNIRQEIDYSEILELEEKLTYLSLRNNQGDQEEIDRILKRVYKTIVVTKEKGLIYWSARVLPNMGDVNQREGAILLNAITKLSNRSIDLDFDLKEGIVSEILEQLPTTDIGIRLLSTGIEIVKTPDEEFHSIAVPFIFPQPITFFDGNQSKEVTYNQESSTVVSLVIDKIEFQTVNGKRYILLPEPKQEITDEHILISTDTYVPNGQPIEYFENVSNLLNAAKLPPRSIPATAPRDVEFFVGRESLQAEIKNILLYDSKPSTIVLLGMGGIGKTSLVTHIAHDEEINQLYSSDNIFWGDLYNATGDATSILRLWGKYCGHELPDNLKDQELATEVRGLLKKRKEQSGSVLVIIDDLRQNWLEAGTLLHSAVPDEIPVIITSREIKAAQRLNARFIYLDVLDNAQAYAFLAARSSINLSDNQAKTIATICNNVPLALELAAQIAKIEGIEYLLSKIKDANKRLNALELDDAQSKEESVRITFEISYNALPEDTKLVFRYLGAFAPVSLISRHFDSLLVYNENKAKVNLEEELRRLRRYSLLQLDVESNETEIYHVQPLLHDYAKSLLVASEEIGARSKHYKFYQDFSRRYADVDLSDKQDIVQEFDIFYPQMQQALENFVKVYSLSDMNVDQDMVMQFIDLVDVLDKYWSKNSQFDAQITWFKIVYEYANKVGLILNVADFSRRIGRSLAWQGRLDEALVWMNRCEEILEEDKSDDANAIRSLMYIHRASIQFQRDDLDLAESDCDRGLEMIDKDTHLDVYAEGKNLLGVINVQKGELNAALQFISESLAAWKQLGNQYQIYRVEDNRRTIFFWLGNFAELRKAEDESLQYWEQFPNRMELAQALTNRGLVHHIDGEYETAIELQKRSIDLSDSLSFQRIRAIARANIAEPYIAIGKYDEAEAYLKESLVIQEEYDVKEYWLYTKIILAEVAVSKVDENALELAVDAHNLAVESEEPLEEGNALRVLGKAYQLNGDLAQARECMEKSLSILHEDEYKYEEYITALSLTNLYENIEEQVAAKEMKQRAEILKKDMGLKIQGDRTSGGRALHP